MAWQTNPEAMAADPNAAPETLYELAQTHPNLRPLIAANPATYPGLRGWLAALGDPEVDRALAAGANDLGATEVLPQVAPVPPSEPAPEAAVQRTSVFPVRAPESAPPSAQPPAQPTQTWDNLVADQPVETAPPPANKTNRGLAIALGLVTLALLLVGGALAFFLLSGKDEAEVAITDKGDLVVEEPEPLPEPTPEVDPVPVESPEPSPSPTAVPYPAPPGSLDYGWFVAPSGNIACEMFTDIVSCTIYENDYPATGYSYCEGGPTTLVADSNGARIACGQPIVSRDGAAPAVPYGQSTVFGQFACHSEDTGISCWDTESGNAFALARAGWTAGSTGRILPSELPW